MCDDEHRVARAMQTFHVCPYSAQMLPALIHTALRSVDAASSNCTEVSAIKIHALYYRYETACTRVIDKPVSAINRYRECDKPVQIENVARLVTCLSRCPWFEPGIASVACSLCGKRTTNIDLSLLISRC